MKKIVFIFFALTVCAVAQEQQMRDSTVYTTVVAKQAVITVNYGGIQVRDTVSAGQVAAWIAIRGGSRDTTMPVRDMVSHLRSEIGRCHGLWLDRMTADMAGVDQDDTQTLAQIRAARAAIRLRYRSYAYPYTVRVPVLEGAAQVAP